MITEFGIWLYNICAFPNIPSGESGGFARGTRTTSAPRALIIDSFSFENLSGSIIIHL